MRIASLLPSTTEIVCALGCGEDLVGISHECDFPEAALDRPVLTRSRIGAPPDSAAIDRAVRAAALEPLSVYEVDEEAFAAARPDVVLTQDLCEVCAVPRAEVERAVARLVGHAVRVVALSPTRLEDVFGDLVRVGDAIGAAPQAEGLAAMLRERLDALSERAAALSERPAVLTIEWLEPPMVGGTWMPDLVERAGGRTLLARPGEPAPTPTPQELAALEPDVVLFKPCGFPLERSLAERERIDDLLALFPRRPRAFLADGNALFNRPGPRLVDSAEVLAACLHPAVFPDLARRHARWFREL